MATVIETESSPSGLRVEPTAEPPKSSRRKLIVLPIIVLLGLAGIIWGVRKWAYGRSHEVDARSVRKKMKDKAFARGVNRDDVVNGAADLGVDLDWHIQFVTDAMKAHAESLGLAGI